MDIDLLNTFLEVSKTHHFGRAAENLYITQAAVSARIKSLEEQLNVSLFDRTTKQVSLTSEGERFIRHAEAIVLAWANARLEIAQEYDALDVLSIGATPGLWHFALNDRMPNLIKKQSLFVNALSYATEDIIRLLFSNALDVAIVYEAINDNSITSRSIGNLNLSMFTDKDNNGKLDISTAPYIHIDWGEPFDGFIDKHFPRGLKTVMQTDNAQTAEAVLQKTGGITYLPERLAHQSHGLIAVEEKFAPVYKRKVYACHASSSHKINTIKDVIRHLHF